MSRPGDEPLDEPVGESLRGAHAHLAQASGRALRYAPGVATFVSVPVEPTEQDWDDLASLLGPGGFADMFSAPAAPPETWEPVFATNGVQMVHSGARPAVAAVDGELVELGATDVRDMLALAAVTEPGPWWERTIEMGTYLGVRRRGELVAMAGERLRPPGWQEISAVCTAPHARGQGLAAALVGTLAARAATRGECAFLHAVSGNTRAQQLYARLGFVPRREVTFRGFRVPGREVG
ncbi:GNAT family N-acetyltransferase [Marmoricola endophyticus]|uniref:GNAT family N-acetyltransferase n=1 Tax=Marmoricola endophyticus TaxID=2040280 RepID=A0A917BL66_9ACTN|nr:GNAT family N-acetyltransferase [Marmoricola endophyticus]GGF48605.1 GNAT family N-acetyltransferase [Marmoricola endophyticus]